MKNEKPKMTKDIVPDDFTITLALCDGFPVFFFGLSSILLGIMIKDWITIVGATITFLSGLVKVLWKVVVALKHKNIWWMFVQMRMLMPIGFLIMIVGIVIRSIKVDLRPVFNGLLNPMPIVFLSLGALGMIMMFVFMIKLDSSDKKSNWIEQITNGFAQLFIFLGLLFSII